MVDLHPERRVAVVPFGGDASVVATGGRPCQLNDQGDRVIDGRPPVLMPRSGPTPRPA
jgi:hypothetical protein